MSNTYDIPKLFEPSSTHLYEELFGLVARTFHDAAIKVRKDPVLSNKRERQSRQTIRHLYVSICPVYPSHSIWCHSKKESTCDCDFNEA